MSTINTRPFISYIAQRMMFISQTLNSKAKKKSAWVVSFICCVINIDAAVSKVLPIDTPLKTGQVAV